MASNLFFLSSSWNAVEEVLLDDVNAVVCVLGHGLDMDGLGELLVLVDGTFGGCSARGAWLVVE